MKKRLNLPPGPIGLPFLGNAMNWANDKTPFLQNLATTFGPVTTFYMMGSPWIVINDCKIEKEILSQYNPRDPFPHTSVLKLFESEDGTPSIIGTRGQKWKIRRKLAQSTLIAMSTSKIVSESLDDSINKVLFPFLNKEKYVNVEILKYIAFNTLFYISMGKIIGINDPICKQLMRLTDDTFRVAGKKVIAVRFPSFKWIPSVNNAIIEDGKIIKKRCAIIRNVINERRKQFDNNKAKCYIDHTIKFVDNGQMTESEQVADIFAFFAAGMDTTSKTLHFGITLAAKHENIQDRVRNELFNIMGRNNKFVLKKVNKCILFKAFIFEILRIASPAMMSSIKISRKPIQICNGKYCIPPRTKFFSNLEYMNRMSGNEAWKHKNEYDGIEICLENWLYVDTDEKQRFKMNESFRAFGSGKRNCIGKQLAIKQIMIVMAYILMNYKLKFTPNQDINQVNKSLNNKTLKMVRDVHPSIRVVCDNL